MSDKPLNPPAFPQQCADALDVGMVHEGMSLRDWFAGQALAGWMASYVNAEHPGSFDDGTPYLAHIAEHSFALADAMIAARAKESVS